MAALNSIKRAAVKLLPSTAYLNECLSYDQVSGVLAWEQRPLSHFSDYRSMKLWNTRWSGRTAGYRAKDGYVIVEMNAIPYMAHRLIWKMMTGCDPANEIDHRNGARHENSWANLRLATRPQNMWNVGKTKLNSTGYKGVCFHRRKNKFQAGIRINGKFKYLGSFCTAIEAHEAYCRAAENYHSTFLYLNRVKEIVT